MKAKRGNRKWAPRGLFPQANPRAWDALGLQKSQEIQNGEIGYFPFKAQSFMGQNCCPKCEFQNGDKRNKAVPRPTKLHQTCITDQRQGLALNLLYTFLLHLCIQSPIVPPLGQIHQ